MTRLLLVGWDAADWKVIDPLVARGEMPHLAALLAKGVRGNLATIYPPLSPMVWTTIATGKRPTKHGIHGFTEPTEDGLSVREVSNLGRKTKAIWNILNQHGKRSIVVGWWPSHPAEPINGAMVSNHYPLQHSDRPDKPMLPGTVHPPAWDSRLEPLRVHGREIPPAILRLFVPDWKKVDQEKDKSLHDLAGIIAETMSIHNAATDLMEHEAWDFAAVYYTGIDHFSHRFMRYHARKIRRRSDDTDPALYQGIVEAGYRYHDLMLGRLVALAGPDCAVMIVSDHGFHSDRLLPDYIPAEAAGPAVEHRDVGVVFLKGPGVLEGQRIYGASVLDITPTMLHLFGLPTGQDMDGKVLLNAFADRAPPPTVPSWDDIPGDDARHPPERQYDGESSVEALNQLVALGYVAPQEGDIAKAVSAAVSENRYNLARAEMDAGHHARAAEMFKALADEDPEQIRYHQHLFQCLLYDGRHADCAYMLDELDHACEGLAIRVVEELDRRRAERADKDLNRRPDSPDRRELFERQKLAEKVQGFATERLLMRCRLLLTDPAKRQAARPLLDTLAGKTEVRRQLGMLLAEGYALLGEYDRALEFTKRIRRADPENWRAITLEASIHFNAGRYRRAADKAVHSLSLIYFQPTLHYMLGLAFARLNERERAEQSFRIALSQAPGFAAAHEELAKLLREDPARIGEVSLHMAHGEVLRARAQERRAAAAAPAEPVPVTETARPNVFERASDTPPAERSKVVMIVSGLPRTGTSMMMQMLAAGGIPVYTDSQRVADEDNPRGYFEHDDATRLHRDSSWVPQARGKVVKIVAQLLRFLPKGENFRVIFMHRNLQEVVASQRAMLQRLGRQGARIGDAALTRGYTGQLVSVQRWLEGHPDIPVLAVGYAEAIRDPSATAQRLARFLGAPFDTAAAAASVDASLRRQTQSEAASHSNQSTAQA